MINFAEKTKAEGSQTGSIRSPEELRALWKKAIQQTVLLLKIEKEKQDIKSKDFLSERSHL
jgi:hypothetical protein